MKVKVVMQIEVRLMAHSLRICDVNRLSFHHLRVYEYIYYDHLRRRIKNVVLTLVLMGESDPRFFFAYLIKHLFRTFPEISGHLRSGRHVRSSDPTKSL